MTITTQEDRIHRALRLCPIGMTTDELAVVIGAKPQNLAARMGKLFLYGKVNKTRALQRNGETATVWMRIDGV